MLGAKNTTGEYPLCPLSLYKKMMMQRRYVRMIEAALIGAAVLLVGVIIGQIGLSQRLRKDARVNENR
ncbi:hypothetical protein BP422_21320 [Brevibacillus formosus]|uniref:Uncharacterized protein n=1 Tax=Brevibacillus formosus TaxID=54913 RepID=A0A220ML84_9BACL|nr:hypothetical protein BP422_21320 [Brevibacillus formosus]